MRVMCSSLEGSWQDGPSQTGCSVTGSLRLRGGKEGALIGCGFRGSGESPMLFGGYRCRLQNFWCPYKSLLSYTITLYGLL